MEEKSMEQLFQEDAGAAAVGNSELANIAQLAAQQITLIGDVAKPPSGSALSDIMAYAKTNNLPDHPELLEFSIADLVGALYHRVHQYRKIATDLLPQAMSTVGGVGMDKFALSNGFVIALEDDLNVAVKADEELKEKAFAWLNEKGLGDIIKNEVKALFGRGEDAKATELREYCLEHGLITESKKSINAQTLKATVKEQKAKGVLFPEEFFNIHDEKKAVVIRPKLVKRQP